MTNDWLHLTEEETADRETWVRKDSITVVSVGTNTNVYWVAVTTADGSWFVAGPSFKSQAEAGRAAAVLVSTL